MPKPRVLARVLLILLASALPALAQETTPAASTAYIRVAHLSPDAPPLSITINGEPTSLQAAAYPAVTEWLELPIGLYTFAAAPLEDDSARARIGPAELSFTRNARITVAVIGSLADDTLTGNLIAEDYTTPIPEGHARLTLYHGAAAAPDVDLRLSDGTVLVEGLGYTGKVRLEAAAGTETIQVVETGTENVLLELPDTVIDAGAFYLLALTGTPGSLQAIFEQVAQT